MDGAVGERGGERVVDQAVLVDEAEPVETRRLHRDVEVVAAARPVDDVELVRVGKGLRSRSERSVSVAMGAW